MRFMDRFIGELKYLNYQDLKLIKDLIDLQIKFNEEDE